MKTVCLVTIINLVLLKLVASNTDVTYGDPEAGDYFEGDIILDRNPFIRVAQINAKRKWPKATVYYELDSSYTSKERANIQKAIAQFHSQTCVRFVERTTQTFWMKFKRGSNGCSSVVGFISRKPQSLNLGPNCARSVGTAVHEMMHTLGFFHEQSRPDRDDYITVLTQNINPKKLGNFNKKASSQVTTLNLPYDYGSVMHYGPRGFSSNGQPTMVAKQKGVTLGQRKGLSPLDVKKVNAYYCKN